MTKEQEVKRDWTHKQVELEDIRQLKHLYSLKIKNIDQPLFVKREIFEKITTAFFLKPLSQISRWDILAQKWNLNVNKGFYFKFNNGEVEIHEGHDPEKYYVSFFDIDGKLGTFSTVIK